MLLDTRRTLGCVGLTYDNLEAGRRSEYREQAQPLLPSSPILKAALKKSEMGTPH